MTEEERKMFAGELKEHILLPGKQDLGNDLNSVEQILVDNKYQVINSFHVKLFYYNHKFYIIFFFITDPIHNN